MRKLYIGVLLGSLGALGACSSLPEKGSLEWQDYQALVCRKACSNSDVAFADLDGVNCFCNKPTVHAPSVPVINNVFYGPQASRAPATTQPPVRQSRMRNEEFDEEVDEDDELEVRKNATVLERHDGRKIYSQVRR